MDDNLHRAVAHAAFGSRRQVGEVKRIAEASKKGVYRLTFDDGYSAILYSWDEAESYWPASEDVLGSDRADPFSHASGIDLFQVSHTRLQTLGVRTPQVYFLDASRSRFPMDVALVEDAGSVSVEDLLERDPGRVAPTLSKLATALAAMRECRGGRFGKVAWLESGGDVGGRSCEEVVRDRALRHLAEAADRVQRLAAVRSGVEEQLQRLAAAVSHRADYRLIHGELDPGHVLVDEHGDPIIIDIEGLMFFDLEWEHVFLQLRYGDHYRWLRADDLDERRMQLYRLAMHLSLVAGPLKLLEGGHPASDFLRELVEYHLQRTLSLSLPGTVN